MYIYIYSRVQYTEYTVYIYILTLYIYCTVQYIYVLYSAVQYIYSTVYTVIYYMTRGAIQHEIKGLRIHQRPDGLLVNTYSTVQYHKTFSNLTKL
jgi:hypothetical protein